VSIPPINPSAVLGLGSEWQIPGVGGISAADVSVPDVQGPAGTGSGGGFGTVLSQQIGKLSDLQDSAASAAQSLADGTATDPSTVVVAVEKAQLAMQLAGQIRTKGAEAISDIFHTQI
jgi:flagellar hook-basal body complex protein FliE